MADRSGRGAGTTAAPAHGIELTGLFAQMLGVWYPSNYVVAAIDPGAGAAAAEALMAAGFGGNAIHLHDSETVCRATAAIYEQRTPVQRAGASFTRALTDEGLMAQDYFDEAKAGASVLAVLAPEPRLVEEARRILATHGARHIRFYGDTSVTDL
jgi:hypothetical protein